jgi:uncharacterized damage-inducible protein DinB
VTDAALKDDLHRYLRSAREAVLWKLDGLAEYDVRRPLVPTGTNLLGLVKHLTTVEWGHFGGAFGRPFAPRPPWLDDPDPDADLWATAEETRTDVVERYRAVSAHSDAVIADLPLDAVGRVPWWPDDIAEVTLHRILVHTIAEAHRHAGHADIVRELVDGAAGLARGTELLPSTDPVHWEHRRTRLERVARQVGGRPPT